jgi:nucleoside-diphosphate-sugar epimerase
MRRRLALVTGAAGFVGRWVVRALRTRGVPVRAGVHSAGDRALFAGDAQVEAVALDVLDRQSLLRAMQGVDRLYHFAALLDPKASSADLFRVNAEGTRRVWECAAARKVAAALYCSSTAVYGLLAGAEQPIGEDVPPRAVEPYGRSKLSGESAALEIAKKAGLPTVIIRPVGIFGLGQTTAFGHALRNAAVSRILRADGFLGKQFSFVHVEDVAEAAVHLLESPEDGTRAYNVAAENAVAFDDAFRAYRNALHRSGRALLRAKALALVSLAIQRVPAVALGRIGFQLWRPGFDFVYSSKRLCATGFRFRWPGFEEVLLSCLK